MEEVVGVAVVSGLLVFVVRFIWHLTGSLSYGYRIPTLGATGIGQGSTSRALSDAERCVEDLTGVK